MHSKRYDDLDTPEELFRVGKTLILLDTPLSSCFIGPAQATQRATTILCDVLFLFPGNGRYGLKSAEFGLVL
jgi:hypothetical protein